MKVESPRPTLAYGLSVGLSLALLVSGCSHQPATAVQWPPPKTDAAKSQEAWVLHGTGVADLVPGAPIPESVYAREGKSFDELWTNPMRGLDQMEVAVQGFRDQEGYPLVKLAKLDVVAQLAHNGILMGIWVGASVRTQQGTGKGSTRAELEAAHGPLSQYDLPEPYHCVLGGSELEHVTFLFREHCSEVQASTPCAAVYVGGYDEPEEVPLHEQPY